MKFSSARAVACLLQCGSLALASLIPPELSSYFSAKEELVPVLDGISITQPAQLIPTAGASPLHFSHSRRRLVKNRRKMEAD
jgi:hypothetical protein